MSEQNNKSVGKADAQQKTDVPQKKKRGGKILPILLVIVIVAAAAGGYYFYEKGQYFSTENAKVTAKMYTITPVTSGELIEWNASLGDVVSKNDILGRQSTLPYITAPIEGTVVVNNGVEGQMVSASTSLAVVADTNHMYIGVNVEETDIPKVKVGQTVDVTLDAYPGKTFKGVVSDIDLTTQTYFSGTTSFSTSGTYTKVTQLIPIKVYIENPEALALTFGMNATVKIHINESVSEETAAAAAALNVVEKTARVYTTTLEASDSMNIITNVAGKVDNVYKGVGDTVVEGDILFELSKTDRELVAAQAEASYNIALSTYESSLASYNSQSSVIPTRVAYQSALDNYNRVKALFDAGSVSEAALESAKASLDSAKAQMDTAERSLPTALATSKAQVDAAKASWDIALKSLADCTVKAPMSGEVASSDVNVGDMVSSSVSAMKIVDPSVVKMTINVTETQIEGVKLGNEATVILKATGGTYTGTITSVAPASNEATGTFPVEIEIQNTDGALKPGMVVNVEL